MAKSPDLFDFFITRQITENCLLVEEGADLSRDSSPVFLTLFDHIILKQQNTRLVNKLMDWNYFQHILDEEINLTTRPQTKDQPDDEILIFTQRLQKAAWKSSPALERKSVGLNYPSEVKILVSVKRKVRKKWQQTRYPAHKTKLNKITKILQ